MAYCHVRKDPSAAGSDHDLLLNLPARFLDAPATSSQCDRQKQLRGSALVAVDVSN